VKVSLVKKIPEGIVVVTENQQEFIIRTNQLDGRTNKDRRKTYRRLERLDRSSKIEVVPMYAQDGSLESFVRISEKRTQTTSFSRRTIRRFPFIVSNDGGRRNCSSSKLRMRVKKQHKPLIQNHSE
jgi:hypothetical protein